MSPATRGRPAARIALAAIALAASPAAAATAPAPRPNFVIIIGDDCGRNDLGPYGHPHIRTPNLDRMAAAGLRFDRAFLSISSCSPARSSILTGRYPHNAGATDAHQHLGADQVSVVETLRAAGWYTASVGKWHLGPDATKRFDRVVRDNGPSGADHWVDELRRRPAGKPFFFWLASNDPHRPYDTTGAPTYRPTDIMVPAFLPDIRETRVDLEMYYEEVERLDGSTGRVLDELERQGVAAGTLVLFLSDDGRPFPRCKTTLYDSGINTPLLARFPSVVKPGGRSPGLVSVIDIAPTLLDLAGVAIPKTMQGKSLAPVLRDPSVRVRDRIFAEQNWHDYAALKRAVRTDDTKYIRNFYPDLPDTPPVDAVRTITFQAMRRLRSESRLTAGQSDCFVKPRPAEELYDLRSDPDELHNLADRPDMAGTLKTLRAALDSWRRDTADREPLKRRPDEYDRDTGEPLPGTNHPPEHE